MLEALAHNQLKHLLQVNSCPWPHNLTLSRLVARSLRRRDNSLIQLEIGSQDFWWIGLLTPLCFESTGVVLVLSEIQRRRFLQFELPRLKQCGLQLSYWEGSKPPNSEQVWIMDHVGLIDAFRKGALNSKHLIIPEAELFVGRLREAMELEITAEDWEILRKSNPSVDIPLMLLYERLSRRLFAHASRVDAQVRMDCSEIVALRDLVGLLDFLPSPWSELLNSKNEDWASWAELHHKTLNWTWHLKLLEPLQVLKGLLNQSFLLIAGSGHNPLLLAQLESVACSLTVKVTLGGAILQEPISLFVPHRQPLPNTEFFALHLLDQSRRLILGLSGLTIVLLDDDQLRLQLTAELAAEFGRRVVHEVTVPTTNGVVCCRWSWWLAHQDQLPLPDQLIVGILPLASVEEPLIAARVEALKRKGRDWFRELLLPEALSCLPQALAPLRASGGRIAILDGRLRTRTWGAQFYAALEPWTPLHRLLPNSA